MKPWKKTFDMVVRICQAVMVVLFFCFVLCGCSVTFSVGKADGKALLNNASETLQVEGSVEDLDSSADAELGSFLELIRE